MAKYHLFFLIHGTHLMEVICYRVCIIYGLMREDWDLNIGAIIFFVMRNARFWGVTDMVLMGS